MISIDFSRICISENLKSCRENIGYSKFQTGSILHNDEIVTRTLTVFVLIELCSGLWSSFMLSSTGCRLWFMKLISIMTVYLEATKETNGCVLLDVNALRPFRRAFAELSSMWKVKIIVLYLGLCVRSTSMGWRVDDPRALRSQGMAVSVGFVVLTRLSL